MDVNIIDLLQQKRPQSLLNKQLYAIQSILQDSQLSETRINPSNPYVQLSNNKGCLKCFDINYCTTVSYRISPYKGVVEYSTCALFILISLI